MDHSVPYSFSCQFLHSRDTYNVPSTTGARTEGVHTPQTNLSICHRNHNLSRYMCKFHIAKGIRFAICHSNLPVWEFCRRYSGITFECILKQDTIWIIGNYLKQDTIEGLLRRVECRKCKTVHTFYYRDLQECNEILLHEDLLNYARPIN